MLQMLLLVHSIRVRFTQQDRLAAPGHNLGQEDTARTFAPFLRTVLSFSTVQLKHGNGGCSHDALLVERDDTVLDPEAVAAHHVGQHHVGGQSVTNDGNLAGACDARFRVVPEIFHDLSTTAGLFGLVRQYRHTCGPLELRGQLPLGIITGSTCSVGNYEEPPTRIGCSQGIEPFLLR